MVIFFVSASDTADVSVQYDTIDHFALENWHASCQFFLSST